MNNFNVLLFKTLRLHVRQLEDKDLESFYDMQSNRGVMKYIKKEMNFEQSKQELDRFIGYYNDDSIFFKIWAIINKNTNQFIGICGVYENDMSELEIAYRLRECFWGKGFGLEIAKGLITYCFEQMKLKELVAYVDKDNLNSIRILEQEMKYVTEIYVKKEDSVERKYKLSKKEYYNNT
ncbi:GNAT family N-acetyltransferase [Aquimarina longa]|uniref:GNAT family N-acetyltransferase n=1 Tax=Aquimarina longa TaxID=1080221 RepID=UPI000781592D|nr:GNAT family N-acetyltransferase [Aquimarina longa]